MLFSYIHQVLVAKRVFGTTCRGFGTYVGMYKKAVKTFTIETSSVEAGLRLSLQWQS